MKKLENLGRKGGIEHYKAGSIEEIIKFFGYTDNIDSFNYLSTKIFESDGEIEIVEKGFNGKKTFLIDVSEI